jgi:hypothetical protein
MIEQAQKMLTYTHVSLNGSGVISPMDRPVIKQRVAVVS